MSIFKVFSKVASVLCPKVTLVAPINVLFDVNCIDVAIQVCLAVKGFGAQRAGKTLLTPVTVHTFDVPRQVGHLCGTVIAVFKTAWERKSYEGVRVMCPAVSEQYCPLSSDVIAA